MYVFLDVKMLFPLFGFLDFNNIAIFVPYLYMIGISINKEKLINVIINYLRC